MLGSNSPLVGGLPSMTVLGGARALAIGEARLTRFIGLPEELVIIHVMRAAR